MQGLKLIKTEKNKKILELSYSMMLNAYAPYSNFSVGAAIYQKEIGCLVDVMSKMQLIQKGPVQKQVQ